MIFVRIYNLLTFPGVAKIFPTACLPLEIQGDHEDSHSLAMLLRTRRSDPLELHLGSHHENKTEASSIEDIEYEKSKEIL